MLYSRIIQFKGEAEKKLIAKPELFINNIYFM